MREETAFCAGLLLGVLIGITIYLCSGYFSDLLFFLGASLSATYFALYLVENETSEALNFAALLSIPSTFMYAILVSINEHYYKIPKPILVYSGIIYAVAFSAAIISMYRLPEKLEKLY